MKKLLYILAVAFTLGFAACSDQNEVVQDLIDEIENRPVSKEFPYTLTTADYSAISDAAKADAGSDAAKVALANAVKSSNSLNSFADPVKYIAPLLGPKYPGLGSGSAIQVTYDFTEDLPAYLATLAAAPTYTLTPADYETVWGAETGVAYFTPAKSAAAQLPAILGKTMANPTEGDIVFASYRYSDQEPNLAPSETPGTVSENFDTYALNAVIDQNGWSQYDETGTRQWLAKSYSGNFFAEVTSYGNPQEVNNVYLVSPEIDLAKNSNPVFSFDAELRFPVGGQDYLRVFVVAGYKATDPSAGTWTDVTDNFKLPTAQTNALAPAGAMSLSGFTGTVRVAFKYQGDGTATPAQTTTLRIDNVQVGEYEQVMGENFEGYTASTSSPYTKWDQNGWSQVWAQGDGSKYWQVRNYSSNNYGQISANGGVDEVTDVYAISPEIDLPAGSADVFSFSVCVGYWNYAGLSVLISEDAAAATSPATVEWTDVTANFKIPEEPTNGYGVIAPAGMMSLKAYAGKKIRIAFRYYGEKGTGNTYTTTFQIDNFSIAAPKAVSASAGAREMMAAGAAVISTPVVRNAVYTYNGTAWAPYDGTMILNPSDYTAMGSSYPNLSPEQVSVRLPEYLARNVEYASEGDVKVVVYTLYANSISATTASEFTYKSGVWAPVALPVTKSDQFVYADSGWIFDPTINLTLAHEDYSIMCDYVKSNSELSPYIYTHSSGAISEYYYGFSENYNNVSFRLSYYIYPEDTELHALDGDNIAQVALLWERFEQKGMPLFLQLKYPLSPVIAQGVQLYYNITVAVFSPDDGTTSVTKNYMMRYKVLTAGSAGTPPTFEFVSTTPL